MSSTQNKDGYIYRSVSMLVNGEPATVHLINWENRVLGPQAVFLIEGSCAWRWVDNGHVVDNPILVVTYNDILYECTTKPILEMILNEAKTN